MTIEYCNLNNANVLYYELHTCEKIYSFNKNISDIDAEKYYLSCSENSGITLIIISGIIFGCIVVILISGLVTYMLIKKRISNMKPNESELSSQ